MALNEKKGWVITYDIRNPKKLVRLHRFLKRRATPIQYSVFHFFGSTADLGKLMDAVEDLINPKADDVRAYAIPARPEVFLLGTSGLPNGVSLFFGDKGKTAPLLRGPSV